MLTTTPSQNFQLRNDNTSIRAADARPSFGRHAPRATARKDGQMHDTRAFRACQSAWIDELASISQLKVLARLTVGWEQYNTFACIERLARVMQLITYQCG